MPISVDTYRADVAAAAVHAGANMVNDISGGLFDDKMLSTVGGLDVPYVLMHTRGLPANMLETQYTTYGDLAGEVRGELERQVCVCSS